MSELEALRNENAALSERLKAARAEILARADRQDAFADPAVYTHLSDADRTTFRHAARMLRDAAELLK